MKLLIIYATTDGQTQKIAEFLQQEAIKMGHECICINVNKKPPSLKDFDAVLIGSPVRIERYNSAIIQFVKNHAAELNNTTSAFFSVSMTASGDDEKSWKGLKDITRKFITNTNWKPNEIIQLAGALKYTRYNFIVRFALRFIAGKYGGDTDTSRDYEYTDWERVKTFLNKTINLVNVE